MRAEWGEINVLWEQAWLDFGSSRTQGCLISLQHLAEAGQAEATSRHPTVQRLLSNFRAKERHNSVLFHPSTPWSIFASNEVTVYMCVCLFAAYSFQVLVSKKLASNLPQSIPLFVHNKSLVHSMESAQLSFIDRKEWTNIVVRSINACHSKLKLQCIHFGSKQIRTVFIIQVVSLLANSK